MSRHTRQEGNNMYYNLFFEGDEKPSYVVTEDTFRAFSTDMGGWHSFGNHGGLGIESIGSMDYVFNSANRDDMSVEIFFELIPEDEEENISDDDIRSFDEIIEFIGTSFFSDESDCEEEEDDEDYSDGLFYPDDSVDVDDADYVFVDE